MKVKIAILFLLVLTTVAAAQSDLMDNGHKDLNCTKNEDCGSGFVCDNNKCVQSTEVSSNGVSAVTECPDNYLLVNGVCQAKTSQAQEEGKECFTNGLYACGKGNSVVSCDGSKWVFDSACNQGEVCSNGECMKEIVESIKTAVVSSNLDNILQQAAREGSAISVNSINAKFNTDKLSPLLKVVLAPFLLLLSPSLGTSETVTGKPCVPVSLELNNEILQKSESVTLSGKHASLTGQAMRAGPLAFPLLIPDIIMWAYESSTVQRNIGSSEHVRFLATVEGDPNSCRIFEYDKGTFSFNSNEKAESKEINIDAIINGNMLLKSIILYELHRDKPIKPEALNDKIVNNKKLSEGSCSYLGSRTCVHNPDIQDISIDKGQSRSTIEWFENINNFYVVFASDNTNYYGDILVRKYFPDLYFEAFGSRPNSQASINDERNTIIMGESRACGVTWKFSNDYIVENAAMRGNPVSVEILSQDCADL